MQNLNEVCADTFRRLSRGVADRRSPWRTPSLATVGLNGRSRTRIVVLRAFDPPDRRLTVHTDIRAGKVAEVRADPAVSVLLWDPAAQIQVRLEGYADLLAGDTEARGEWDRLHPGSRLSYRAKQTPGTPLADPSALELLPEEKAFDNFMVIRITIRSLDWLQLSRERQRRAQFSWGANASQAWLVP